MIPALHCEDAETRGRQFYKNKPGFTTTNTSDTLLGDNKLWLNIKKF